MKLVPYLTPKLNSKWCKDLTVGAKTVQLSEGNTGINLDGPVVTNGFLDLTPKVQATKEKTGNLDFFKIKNVGALKDNTKEDKIQPLDNCSPRRMGGNVHQLCV